MWKALSRIGPVNKLTKVQGIDCIRTGRSGFALNTAVYCYRIGDTLLDSGTPNQWHKIRRYLEQHSTEEDPVIQTVVSHHHEDHAGNGYHLQKEFNLPVYAPSMSIPLIRDGFHLEYYRRIVWGTPRPFEALPLPSEIKASIRDPSSSTQTNQQVTIVPIHTPGHCQDHHCFYVPEKKWLFSADLLVTSSPQMARFDENVLEGMDSLSKVIDGYDIDTVFCSHRGPVTNGKEALKLRLENLRKLRQKAAQMYTDDPTLKLTPKEIARELLGNESFLAIISGNDFSKRNLIKGLLHGYEEYKTNQKWIGRMTPEQAMTYLSMGSAIGPGSEPATLLANEKWLNRNQIRIDQSATDRVVNVPGTGLTAQQLSQTKLNADRSISENDTKTPTPISVSATVASQVRAQQMRGTFTQPSPASFTVLDAQQMVKSAHSQRSVMPQAETKPMWLAPYVSSDKRQQVLMPDMSMRTPEEAVTDTRARKLYRQHTMSIAESSAHEAVAAGSAVPAVRITSTPKEDVPVLSESESSSTKSLDAHRRDSVAQIDSDTSAGFSSRSPETNSDTTSSSDTTTTTSSSDTTSKSAVATATTNSDTDYKR